MDGVMLGWRERWSDACRDGGIEGRIISMMERGREGEREGCRD